MSVICRRLRPFFPYQSWMRNQNIPQGYIAINLDDSSYAALQPQHLTLRDHPCTYADYVRAHTVTLHDVNENGQVKQEFFDRRDRILDNCDNPVQTHDRILGWYHEGQICPLVASREHLIPIYCEVAMLTTEYGQLRNLHNVYDKVCLVGSTGRNVAAEQLEHELYHPYLPFTHELILTGLLSKTVPWLKWSKFQADNSDSL